MGDHVVPEVERVMNGNSQQQNGQPESQPEEFPWVVLYLEKHGTANEFLQWSRIFALGWEQRRAIAGQIERAMFNFIRDFMNHWGDPDESLAIAHCKDITVKMGLLCDPRKRCPHFRDGNAANRVYRDPSPYH